MISHDELNPSIQAFLRNDWNFGQYIGSRTESNEDLNLINDVLKSGGDVSNLPDDKQIMRQMFETPEEKIQEMVDMAQDSDLMAYVATKIVTKIYDKMLSNRMKQEHIAEQKEEDEQTDDDKKKLKQMPFKMKITLKKEMEKASEEFETILAVSKAMAKANDGTTNHQELDAGQLIDIANKSNEMLAKILKLVGHFQGCFDHKLRTKSDAIENLCGVKMGNEIPNLLPSEVMMMMDKDFESIKTLDFIKRNTLQYKFKGKSPQTEGPIVCCIDESGSMRGERIELAKAFCFGLFQQAKKQNREFQVIRFGDTGFCEKTKINNGLDLIEVSKKFYDDNGTDFQPPLQMAMDIITTENKYNKADIVMITDGESRLNNGFIKKVEDFKKATNTKIITLSIERWWADYGLGKLSDTVVFGSDFDRLVELV